MPDTPQRRAPPSATSEISDAMVRIVHDCTGRGPTMAKTTIGENLVTVLMGENLLKGERRLVADGQDDVVLRVRHSFQEAMREEMVEVVGDVTGRTVTAFMSDNHLDPDLAIEVFVLDPQDGPTGE